MNYSVSNRGIKDLAVTVIDFWGSSLCFYTVYGLLPLSVLETNH